MASQSACVLHKSTEPRNPGGTSLAKPYTLAWNCFLQGKGCLFSTKRQLQFAKPDASGVVSDWVVGGALFQLTE